MKFKIGDKVKLVGGTRTGIVVAIDANGFWVQWSARKGEIPPTQSVYKPQELVKA